MYRVYELTEKETGKIFRRRWDGDTYYFDVYESPEELEKDSDRIRKINEEAEKEKRDYLEFLTREEAKKIDDSFKNETSEIHTTPQIIFEGSPEQWRSNL